MNKTSLVECELRGPITWSDFNNIKPFIEKEWGSLKHFVELVVFFKGEHDLRLKINNNGVELVLKKTIKKGEARSEIIFKAGIDQIKNAIELIYNLGFTEGLFSNVVERYEVINNNKSISFKFGSRIGNFFEIEELIKDNKKIDNALNRVKRIAKRYGLLIWENEVYQNLVKDSWKNVKFQKLIEGDKIHSKINEAYLQIQKFRSKKNIKKI